MGNVTVKRKKWFINFKKFLRLFIRRTEFIYLGEKVKPQGIILCNHEGSLAPFAFELYSGLPIRFWGTYEMNSGLKGVYKYQTEIYYHQKKKWNIYIARILCLIISPLTNFYYKGLNLISTYRDFRLIRSFKESIEHLNDGHNLVIFPEMSENGYFQTLTGFHPGISLFFEQCLKNNLDVPVYVSYYRKKERKCIIDKPVLVSELLNLKLKKEELANVLCDRCNELGKINID